MTSPTVLAAVEAALVEHFGHRSARASVSFVGVDPIEVLRFEPIPGERAYLSLGMSRHPMTGAADAVLAPDGPRAELMLHLRDPTDEHAEVWRRVALLAAAPVVEGVVYAPGMSIDLGEPLTGGSACTGVVVDVSPIGSVDAAGGTVAILQITPATSTELAWCRVRGSAALRDLWTEAGADLLDLGRRPVALDGTA
ncbi:MAG: suppressor of fused domain protein [Jatrophihabitans sp.]|uniref:suppressor of fused domain protein n=1 Tax=Jatrophihabitans sp. TaxID=1932789 RepID=UPI00390F6979